MPVQSGFDRLSYGATTPNVPQIPSVAPKVHPQTGGSQNSAPAVKTPQVEVENVVDATTLNDTMQDGVIHEKSGSSTQVRRKAPVVKKKVSREYIQIRDFPREVMDIVRGVVPGGNSYVETLLAYIYVTSPTKFEIPENVQEIVDAYVQDDALTQVFKEIRLLREQMKNVEMAAYQGAIASEYNLFNDLGLRKDTVTNPSEINYLEPGVEDMHIALEQTAKQVKKKDTIRRGRK